MSANTPLESQRKIIRACRFLDIPFIFWQQDIISIAARKILSKKSAIVGAVVGGYFKRLEKRLLQQSRRIVVIAQEFEKIITRWGLPEESIDVVPNWAPIADIPMLPQNNGFSEQHGLDEKFVILYSGTMGMKHNPYMVSRLAAHFAGDARFQFVVATDGVGWKVLNEEVLKNGLRNLLLLPLQPFEIFPQVLASANILLVLLEQEAGVFSVPSKVWSGYCAAKPTLLAAPKDNLAATITRRINAGVVVAPDDFDGAVAEISTLAADDKRRAMMGKNARQFAEKEFPIEHVADKFERIFESALRQ